MLFFFVLIVVFVHLHEGCCKKCPSLYKRLDRNHSFCKHRNPQCTIYAAGLNSKLEIEEILSVHNKYRSKVAIGNEAGAGGLPTAADMMQMVWDDELAAIAQQWAEQCQFEHDCRTCRAVPSFMVGQNIAYQQWSCPKGDCRLVGERHPHNWTDRINKWSEEIELFDKDVVNYYPEGKKKGYGHLTQIMWAKTWRVGCGYVAHLFDGKYRHLHICNYGPGGNIIEKPVYTVGKPCSRCPSNTCCGKSCKGRNVYPGLCRMLDDNSAPIYGGRRRNGVIFYSDFGKRSASDVSIRGINNWIIRQTLSGNILSIVLNGGERSIWHLRHAIVPSEAFCMTLKYRKGPAEAGQKDSNKLELLFEPVGMVPVTIEISPSSAGFITYNLDLAWTAMTMFSIVFSVPVMSPPQYLDVQSIVVTNRHCSNLHST